VNLCPFVVESISTPHPQSLSPIKAEREESQPQLLEPVVHFLEMKIPRAEGFAFAGLHGLCATTLPSCQT
jgi:hypothetical protein